MILPILGALTFLATPALGQADFHVTGTRASKACFQKGLLYLHSFMYDDAAGEFRAATAAEPGFVMGRWGEAMALNHPVWNEQATDDGRTALAAIGDLAHVTPLEREWVGAVKVLYLAKGTKQERDRAYAAAMDKMRASHPDNLEVEVFDALAKLGVSVAMSDSVRLRMEAGALALDAYGKNPDHPGAAHYAIHAFDDSDHAILALPAARRYASIAPAAVHARHMPAHTFVQLGMWPEASAACQAAIEISEAEAKAKGKGRWSRDNHSARWLMGLRLEQGEAGAAREELARIGESPPHNPSPRARENYAAAALAYLLETGSFNEVKEVLAPLDAPVQPDATAAPAKPASSHYGPPYEAYLRCHLSQIHGYAAVAAHDFAAANREADAIHGEIATVAEVNDQKNLEDSELLLRAGIAWEGGHLDEGIADLRKAIEVEKALPPPTGLAEGLSPWELLGAMLLDAKRPAEAAVAFATALQQHPGRARSLFGAARAAAALGDVDTAAADDAKVAAIWQHADDGWPGLAEARGHGTQASSSH